MSYAGDIGPVRISLIKGQLLTNVLEINESHGHKLLILLEMISR